MNRQVIEDFRAHGGAVDNAAGAFFRDKPVLILHNTGAKSGQSGQDRDGNTTATPDFDHALRVHRLLDAVQESSDQRHTTGAPS